MAEWAGTFLVVPAGGNGMPVGVCEHMYDVFDCHKSKRTLLAFDGEGWH